MRGDVPERVTAALEPLLEFCGYRYGLSGDAIQTQFNHSECVSAGLVSLVEYRPNLVRVIDLHGLSQHEAQQRLDFGPYATAVYFGKGEGVLRTLFRAEVASANELLIGESGDTSERPESAVGVVITPSFQRMLEQAVDKRDADERAAWSTPPVTRHTPPEPVAWTPTPTPTPTPRNTSSDDVDPIVIVIGVVVLCVLFPPAILFLVIAGAIWLFTRDS